MSDDYQPCSLCGESTLVDCTNMDEDLGIVYVHGNLVCPDCVTLIRDVSEEDEDTELEESTAQ